MGSYFPDQGSNLHPVIGRQCLNHWTTRESSTKSWSNTWTIPNLEYFPPVILSSPSDIDSNVRFTETFSFQSFYLNFQLPNASYPLPFPISMHDGLSWWLSVKKNLPAMQETQEIWVQSLGSDGPLLEENGNPFHSWLKNPMDRGAWTATVQRAAKSWTQLSDQAHTHYTMYFIYCFYLLPSSPTKYKILEGRGFCQYP